jgi:hypothetical protein
MKPIDYRNETFAQVYARVEGSRAEVLAAWCAHGPCTTKELAERSGLSLLSLRPRTTELYQAGFVICMEELAPSASCLPPSPSGEARYRAASPAEAASHFRRSQIAALNPQAELALQT